MDHFLTLTTLVLGLITCVVSVTVALIFYRQNNTQSGDNSMLTRALSWQLLGEACIGGGTLVFTMAAYFGVLPGWPIDVQSYIRISMFLATSLTTLHLYSVVRYLRRG